MPKASYIASKGLVITPGAGLDIEKANGTTSSNAVTVNGTCGVITVGDTQSIAAGGIGNEQTVTNNRVKAGSAIILKVIGDAAATGLPCLTTLEIADGSFKFVIGNAHASGAVTAQNLKISYLVV
jgi:hypothetical protein